MSDRELTEFKYRLQALNNIDNSIFLSFGKNTKKWLDSIICPKCNKNSKIDYGLQGYYKQPCFICLNCKTIYKIDKVKWKNTSDGLENDR